MEGTLRALTILLPALVFGCGATSERGTDTTGDETTGDETTGDETTGDETTGDETTGDDCPVDVFLDVSEYPGPGGNYPAPVLEVSCTDDVMTVVSNGIPHYEFVPITPNDLQAQDYSWDITRHPEIADEPTDIPLLGTMAVAVNGTPIYGPNEAAQPDPYGDPIYNDIMDACLGHTAGGGRYHFHGLLLSCLAPDAKEGEVSPIIGYALDGFPIYGPMGCLDAECAEVVELKSSWVTIGDPTTYAWDANEYQANEDPQYLDKCNGRVGPDGTYRYHATSTFPYVLGCFTGTATGVGPGGGGPGGGGPG